MRSFRISARAAAAWGAWLAMLAGALLFIARFASNVPSWDDWDMVPTLTGNQPVTWEWLWSQHNEHRVPLPRLIFLGLNRLTLVDMRVTMYFDVLLMAGLACAMIATATRLRGRSSAADAFFPLALLNWGQAANMLWGWQLQFFASVALALVAILALARAGTTISVRRAAAIVGACAVLLPLCGANGLGMVPALAAWPLALAVLPERWTGGRGTRGDPLLLALGGAALALTVVYFIGWEPVPYHPKSQSIVQTLKTTVKFVTIGFGPAVRGPWPLTGIAALAVLGGSVVLLLRVWRDRPGERSRALGLLFGLGAVASLALGLGLGRNGFETRYVTLALPAWCAVYFAWLLYAPKASAGMQGALAVASLAALWGNTMFGLEYARELRGQLAGFERDMTSGVPLHELLHRYGPWLHPHQDMAARYLPMLKQARVGRYGSLRPDPAFDVVPLDLRPVEVTELAWHDSTAQVVGPRPALVFRLPADRVAAGIRLRYRYRSEDGTLPYIGIRWKPAGQPTFTPDRFYKYSPTGDRANWERGTWDTIGDSATTLTVWISDTVGEVGITPDFRPATFRIEELSLLVAER
ncbi:MAG TPA: hypothetical protein VMY76_01170 [Gemmatimonadales bacterium]|nr:hypothetical protein [Gemmatimonadales bacterium]